MARNRSELLPRVEAHKVWFPKDIEFGYIWKTRGGCHAFLIEKALVPAHDWMGERWAIIFQNHKAYASYVSVRYYDTRCDALAVWGSLDHGPKIKDVDRGFHWIKHCRLPPVFRSAIVPKYWDGESFADGHKGPWG